MTEAELLGSLRKAARDLGWLEYHTFNAYRSPRGFPDLVLARGLHLIVVELKSDKGKVTPEQESWLAWWRAFAKGIDRMEDALARIERTPCVDVFVWRPADLEDAYRVLAARP